MLISTTSLLEGKKIKEYRGIVFGEAVSGIHFVNDFAASISDFVGGRSKEYEGELVDARADAISEMIDRAKKIGANALVGVKVDIDTINGSGDSGGSMLMVTVSGTAVVVE